MEHAKYYILIGLLLFAMAFALSFIKKLPFTSSVVYLLFGIMLGKHGIEVLDVDPLENTKLFEVIAEVTVIISLFTVGLKLKAPFEKGRWKIPFSMATLSMVLTVGLISVLTFYLTGLDIGHSIIAGAVLAPTDPVLASDVQLNSPDDHNHLKFNLTSEGGMNDGTAFPFVMLGLGLIGVDSDWSFGRWMMLDLFWSIFAGVGIGILCGISVSKAAHYVKYVKRRTYFEDFLTIASIALSYGLAIQCHAYGFLTVFANALTIRQMQTRKKLKVSLPDDSLAFNEQLERIFEVLSVGIVGLLIDIRSFAWEYLLYALAIFLLIRPLAIFIGTHFTSLKLKEKLFLSWFGIRGIGSIYYLYYAFNHDSYTGDEKLLLQLVLWTIVLSILIHGISVNFILKKMKF